MARTALTVVDISRLSDITDPPIADPAGTPGQVDGHFFVNDGHCVARITNADIAAARTITFVTGRTVGPAALAIADEDVEVPIDSTVWWAIGKPGTFNQPALTVTWVNYEAGQETDFTVTIFRFVGVGR